MKLLRNFSIAAVICLALRIAPASAAEPPPPSVRIGVVIPLTGPIGFQGLAIKDAMTLARDESGTERFELLFEDDGFQPKQTVTAVQKLIGSGNLDALVVFGATQGASVADIAERSRLPMISLSVMKSVTRGRKYVVNFFPSTESLTGLAIRESTRRGYRTVAIVASIQDAALHQKQIFTESGAAKIVYAEEFAPGDQEFRSAVTKIRSLSPDAVFISMLPPQGSSMVRDLRNGGYGGAIFTGIQTASDAEAKQAGKAIFGSWAVSGDDRPAKEFYRKFGERFGPHATPEAIYAYDAMRLLASASETKDINHFLHTVRGFNGALGTYDADGDASFTFPVVAKEFTPEGFRYLAEPPA